MGRRYKKKGGGSGFGSAVSDSASIANKRGPKGALITGILGFILFYFILPLLMLNWVEHNKAKMGGQHAAMFGKMLDEIFWRRFIHPSEWAGIAILIICVAFAVWKAISNINIDRHDERSVTLLGKIAARFLD